MSQSVDIGGPGRIPASGGKLSEACAAKARHGTLRSCTDLLHMILGVAVDTGLLLCGAKDSFTCMFDPWKVRGNSATPHVVAMMRSCMQMRDHNDVRQVPAAQARHVADLLHVTLAALGVNDELAKAQEVCEREVLLLAYIAGVGLARGSNGRGSLFSTVTCTGLDTIMGLTGQAKLPVADDVP